MDQHRAGTTPPPTLIVCPPTLVSHWAHEIGKFVEGGFLQPLQYQGTPKERALLQPLLTHHNIVVASYESVKADVDWLAQQAWLYCVLDEGHIIRNPKSKITQVCVPPHQLALFCKFLLCWFWLTIMWSSADEHSLQGIAGTAHALTAACWCSLRVLLLMDLLGCLSALQPVVKYN